MDYGIEWNNGMESSNESMESLNYGMEWNGIMESNGLNH